MDPKVLKSHLIIFCGGMILQKTILSHIILLEIIATASECTQKVVYLQSSLVPEYKSNSTFSNLINRKYHHVLRSVS